MDRIIIPVPGDDSHEHEIWDHASPSESERRKKIYPDPMPAGYHLAYRWVGRKLEIGPVRDTVTDEKGEIVVPQPVATFPAKHAPPGSPADLADKAQQKKAARAHELAQKHNKNDLMTMAAELGVPGMSRSLSVAQMAGKIVDWELEVEKGKAKEAGAATSSELKNLPLLP